MSTHTIKGFITYCAAEPWQTAPTVGFTSYDPGKYGDHETVAVREHSFEVEVPDNFDSRPAKIAALEEERRTVRAELAKRLMEIEDSISKLLALSNEVPA